MTLELNIPRDCLCGFAPILYRGREGLIIADRAIPNINTPDLGFFVACLKCDIRSKVYPNREQALIGWARKVKGEKE